MSFWPLILGTLKATLVGMLFACPLGVAAAVFSSEFAPRAAARGDQAGDRAARRHPVGGPRLLRADRPRDVDAGRVRVHLSAERVERRASRSVSRSCRSSSRSPRTASPRCRARTRGVAGARLVEAADRVRVVLPAATPAIFASFVLAFGRAIGETMILLMAGGNAAIASLDFGDPLRTLSATIAAEIGRGRRSAARTIRRCSSWERCCSRSPSSATRRARSSSGGCSAGCRESRDERRCERRAAHDSIRSAGIRSGSRCGRPPGAQRPADPHDPRRHRRQRRPPRRRGS